VTNSGLIVWKRTAFRRSRDLSSTYWRQHRRRKRPRMGASALPLNAHSARACRFSVRLLGVALAAVFAATIVPAAAQQQPNNKTAHATSSPAARAAHHAAPVTHHAAPVTHHTAPVTHHVAPVTHHAAPVTHHAAPVTHHAAPAAAAPLYHATRTQHATSTQVGTVRLRSTSFVRGVTSYHSGRYHGAALNATYARHPSDYGGSHWASYGGHRWYDGYWHNYWTSQDWVWWGGHYGFWLDVDGIEVFVYEYAPGDCQFWNGSGWASWYDAPFTPYYCPY
jgi:hypothetical protein